MLRQNILKVKSLYNDNRAIFNLINIPKSEHKYNRLYIICRAYNFTFFTNFRKMSSLEFLSPTFTIYFAEKLQYENNEIIGNKKLKV